MKLTLGFSPCPNDTFMFDALVHNKIDTEGLELDVILADVSQLNKWSFNTKLDITKISFGAFTRCVNHYALLDSGSALGHNCGPLLIKKPGTVLKSESQIAIPGDFTTANMLLSIAYPEYINKIEQHFSDIETSVINETVDAGLIIHENRFTYKNNGLEKVKDLGEFWEQETGLPIPLGGIVIRREFPLDLQRKINRVLKRSIEYAFANPNSSSEYIQIHAQEIEKKIIDAHIHLYVNDFSLSLKEKGRNAVRKFFQKSSVQHQNIFV